MKDWERERLEYRPPSPPRQDILGESKEIIEEAKQNTIAELPEVIQESLAHLPSDALGVAEKAGDKADKMVDELKKCLMGDSKEGVSFEDYVTAKEKDEDDLDPIESENILQYEMGHNLDPKGKPQVMGLSELFDIQKEIKYYQEVIKKLMGVTEKDTVDSLKEKQIRERQTLMDDIINGRKTIDDPHVKSISQDTKIAYLVKTRMMKVMEYMEELQENLSQNVLSQTAYNPETFVYELAKGGVDNTKKLKKIQENALIGSSHRLYSQKQTAQAQKGKEVYEEIISQVMAVNEELKETDSVINWISSLDDECFEMFHPMGELIDDTINSIQIGHEGLYSIIKEWEMSNRTAEEHEHMFNDCLYKKMKNHNMNNLLGTMIEHYDFSNNDLNEATKFVKKFKLDKKKNICGN